MAAAIVEKVKSELSNAGLSEGAISGILKIAATYKPKEGEKPDLAQAAVLLKKLFEELEVFIKTQSESDQKIYHEIVEKKKAELAELIKK
uniref:Surface anchored protein n=1 Tax=Caenorhabditis tropicalis TaxID=1561998 RepID=A0A1I7T1N2_9PELO